VGRCPVDAGKIRLFTQSLAEADAEDGAKLRLIMSLGYARMIEAGFAAPLNSNRYPAIL